MNDAELRKSKEETRVLEEALAKASSLGGESRANAERMRGRIEKSERPDFIIHSDDGHLIGIEHFRSCHLVRNDKSHQSRVAIHRSKTKDEFEDAVKKYGSNIPKKTMFEVIERGVNVCSEMLWTPPRSMPFKSLEAALYGKNGHIRKLGEYRKSLQAKSVSGAIETGFLIELRSSFPVLFLNDGAKVRKLEPGHLPMYGYIYDLLERASSEVDWLIVATYPEIGDNITGAVIVKCKNGMFKESLERQGLKRTEYLGLGWSPEGPGRLPKPVMMRFDEENTDEEDTCNEKTIFTSFEREELEDVPYYMLINAFGNAARAINLERDGIPFTATIPVQMLYELDRNLTNTEQCQATFYSVQHEIYRYIRKKGIEDFYAWCNRFAMKYNLPQTA